MSNFTIKRGIRAFQEEEEKEHQSSLEGETLQEEPIEVKFGNKFRVLSEQIKHFDIMNRGQLEQSKMLFEMRVMGFNEELAVYALKSVQYHSKDRAVDFLMEIGPDEKYQHPFIEGNNGCAICQEDIEVHLNEFDSEEEMKDIFENNDEEVEPNRIPQSLEVKLKKFQSIRELTQKLSQNLALQNEEGSDRPWCKVCYEDYLPDNGFKFECGHKFCLDCVKSHLKELINKAQVQNLGCLEQGCETLLKEEELEQLFRDEIETVKKYKKFLLYKKIESDPLSQWCQRTACQGYGKAVNPDDEFVICVKCKGVNCLKCGYPFHEGRTCQSEDLALYKVWKAQNRIMKCPFCKYHFEKINGCNRVRCIKCRKEWCYGCGGPYIYHDCEGVKRQKQLRKRQKKMELFEQQRVPVPYYFKCEFITLVVLLFPLFLVFVVPWLVPALVIRWFMNKYTGLNNLGKIIAVVGILFITVPLVIPLFFMVVLPWWCSDYQKFNAEANLAQEL